MTEESFANRNRVAKNTMLLYFRLVITIIVGLYTSRVVLSTLGFSDYGLYNVVGGMVAMFAFLNNAMVSASQRFLSFEIGKGNKDSLALVFGTTYTTHLILALIIGALSLIVGFLFIYTKLNIVEGREIAAICVLITTTASFMINISNVPYRSAMVAHEHMNFFAFQSILECALSLMIVYMLRLINYDKLITYTILQLSVCITMTALIISYSRRHFEECKTISKFDIKKFKEMFLFSFWSIIGNFGITVKDQGSNMVINTFCGTTINAARGIAIQVGGVISNFSSSFMTAINPQITKTYAAGDLEQSRDLVYFGTRSSFYLLSLIVVPFVVNIDFVLNLWLEEVPPYTSIFVIFTLVSGLIFSISQAVTTGIQATGDIKLFQIVVCVVMLLEVPIVYLILKTTSNPALVMIPSVIVNFIALVSRILILKRKNPVYSVRYYLIAIVLKNFVLLFCVFYIAFFLKSLFNINFWTFLLLCLLSELLIAGTIFFLGLNKAERLKCINIVNNKINSILK